MASPSEQLRAAVVPGPKRVSLRARQGRSAPEADGPGRVLGLRRIPGARRWTGVRLQQLFEPMAKSMERPPLVKLERHLRFDYRDLLAYIDSKRAASRRPPRRR
jgi:hypothetical protein